MNGMEINMDAHDDLKFGDITKVILECAFGVINEMGAPVSWNRSMKKPC